MIQLEDNGSSVNKTACGNGISMELFLHCSLGPAVFIVAILSYLQGRVSQLAIDEKLPFLKGRFGIVVPLDFIGSLSNRWSYGFAFGAISSSVMLLFSEEYLPFHVPHWARAVVYLVGALEVGLAYLPFFACLSTPCRGAGAVLGVLYSLVWVSVTLWDTVSCPHGKVLGKFQKPIMQWPSILCLIFLLFRFHYMLVKAIRVYMGLESGETQDQFLQTHQARYVQRLLRNPAAREVVKNWFQRKIYDWDPHFKFPNRMIGTTIVCLVGLYMVALADHSLSSYTFDNLDLLRDSMVELVNTCQPLNNNFAALTPELVEFSHVARKTWLATIFFSCLTSVSYVFHVLSCYRKQLRRLWAGQRDFLPQRFRNPRNAVSVAAITRYSGWQIAFMIWGYMIIHFVQFLFALLFAYGVVLPIQHGRGLKVLANLGILMWVMGVMTNLTIVLVVGLVVLQIILAQVFFLQDKISPTDPQKPLAINNRKAFHNFNYFFFFYNVIMALSNCILRLLLSTVVGTWLVPRIDRTIMQRGYEYLDPGYNTWIGMIFADHYHSNPIMICFCHLLLTEKLHRQKITLQSYSQFSNISPVLEAGSRAHRRWLLLYTLMKNPRLILERKRQPASHRTSLDTVTLAWMLVAQSRAMAEKDRATSTTSNRTESDRPNHVCLEGPVSTDEMT